MQRVHTGRLVALGGSCVVVGACGSAPCVEADDAGFRKEEAITFCELVDVIEASDLSGTSKELLMECLEVESSESERDELLETFQSASDEDLESFLLSRLLDCDTYKEYWADQDVH